MNFAMLTVADTQFPLVTWREHVRDDGIPPATPICREFSTPRFVRPGFPILVLILALAWEGSPVEGDGRELDLSWSTADGRCAGGADVHRQVERLLGRKLRQDAPTTVVAKGRIHGAADDWTLSLEVQTAFGHSQRTFEAQTCATLTQVAALFLALAVDPVAVTQKQSRPRHADPPPLDRDGAPSPGPAGPPEVPKSEPETAPPPGGPVARPGPTVGVGLVAGASLGMLPGVAPTFGADASMTWPRFRLVFGARYLPNRTARDDEISGVGLEIRHGVGSVRTCPVLRAGNQVVFPLCVGIEAGAQSALAFGVRDPERRTSPWLAATVGTGLIWTPGPHLGATVHVGAAVPILRPGFGIENLGELHRVGFVGTAAGLGVEARIPTIARTSSRPARRRRGAPLQ